MAAGLLGVVVGSLLSMFPAQPAIAAPGINKQINFQGKVTNSNGTNVANGSYNFTFRIYNATTGNASGACAPTGACLWQEASKSLTVTDGIFQTALGDTTALPGSVDFNTDNIYLGITFNGDPEMSPRIQFTGVPYSFNSDLLDGLDSSAFAQLNPGSAQSGSLNVTGSVQAATSLQAPLVDTATAVALNIGTGTATSVTIGRTTTPFLIQGNSASTFTGTNGSFKTTVGFTTPTANNSITFPDAGGKVCTDTASTCSATYQVAGSYLAKNAADTSSFAVTATNFLYGFTNSSSAVASGVLKLDNGNNTGSGLTVVGSGNPAAGQALILANGATGITGNLIDLQVNAVSKFSVNQAGAVTTASTINGQTISSAANFTGTVTAANTLTVSAGGLTVTSGGAGITGTTNINITGAAATTIGSGTSATSVGGDLNVGGTLQLASSVIEVGTPSNYGAIINVNTFSPGNIGEIIRGTAAQAADLMQLQDSAGNVNGKFNTNGNQLTLGRIAGSGTVTAGALLLGDGTTDNFGATLNTSTLTANRTISLPDAGGTICTTVVSTCGGTSGAYVSLQSSTPGTAQTGHLNLSGTGIFGTSVLTPLVDVASAGTLSVGTSTANALSIGKTGVTTTHNGTNQIGASAGTGAFVNNGTTQNTTSAISNLNYTGTGNTGALGTAAATVDVYTAFTLNQTTAGQTITVPTPTVGAAASVGRVVYVANIGSASFTLLSGGAVVSPGSSATLVHNGTNWTFAGADGSGILNQNGSDQTADFRISGTGRANTSFVTPLIDSITGGLSIGTATATSLLIGGTTNTATVTLQGATAANYNIGTATGTGTITVGQSTDTNTISIGGGATATTKIQTINIGTGNLGSGTGKAVVTIGNTNGASSVLLQAGTGGLSLQTQGTGTLGIGNNAVAQTLAIGNATGATAVTIASGTGNLALTTNGTGQLNIGNNAVAQTINVGNATGATTVAVAAGTGGLTIQTQGTGTLGIGNNAVAQTLAIGNSTGATAVNIACGTGATACQLGTNAIAHTTIVGTTTGAGATTIQSGTGNLSITTLGTGTLGVGNNAVAQTINVGNATGATTVAVAAGTGGLTIQTQGTGTLGIGNNAVAQTLAIGNATGATAVTIAAGTGNLALTTNGTGQLNIGNNAVAQTINIGNSTGGTGIGIASGTGGLTIQTQGTGTLGIGNNAVAQTIVVGNTTGATGLTLQAGSAGITLGSSAGQGVLTNNGSTVNTAYAMANLATGGWDAGGAAATVDKYTYISANQTAGSQTLIVPAPTANTAYGRLLYLSNIGTASFTLLGTTIGTGSTATLVWANKNGGAGWTFAGADGSGILNQSTADQTGDFRISGTGRANTSFTAPLFDAISGSLNIGTSTATGVTIGGAATTGTIAIGSAAASTLNIGTGAFAHTIAIGTGGAAQAVSVGSTNTTSSLSLQAGSAGLTANATAGNLTVSTTTSGTLALNSAGALTVTAAAASSINTGANALTVTTGGTSSWANTSGNLTLSTATAGNIAVNSVGTLALTGTNFNLATTGVVTLAGAQTADITTLAGTAPTALVFQPGNNTTATSTGAAFTLQAGNDSGATAATGGLLTLKGGNATGGTQVGGGVTIDSGTGTTGGAVTIGGTSAASVAIGRTGVTTTHNGTNQIGASTGTGALVNNGSTVNTSYPMANLAGGGWDAGGAATTVDKYTFVTANQTTTLQTLTIPTPTASTTYGRLLYLTNGGTASFTLLGTTIGAGSTATLIWSLVNSVGTWTFAGADGSGILNQSSADQTANFRISGIGRANNSFTAPLFDSITGGLNIGTTTATGITIGGAATTGTIAIGSAAASTVNIGTGAFAHTIAIGNDATTVQAVTVGSTNSTSATTLQAGSGNINLNAATVATNQATVALFNATATTVNEFAAATAINVGAANTVVTYGNSGAATLRSVTGALTITSAAAATWSATGNLTVDSSATLNLGTSASTGVAISKTGNTTNINGTTQIGTLNTAGTGALVNNGSTVNSTYAMANLATGGWDAGGAAATVDIYTAISANQTTAAQTLTIPSPTANTVYGRVLVLSNIGTASFTVLGATISTGSSASLVWANKNGGAGWSFAGSDASSLQTAYNNSAGGTVPSIVVSTVKTGVSIQNSNTSGIAAGTEIFGVRSAVALDVTAGPSLLSVSSYGLGVNLGSVVPAVGFDLQFGGTANRVIGVQTQATAATAGVNLTVRAATGNTSGAGGVAILQGGTGGTSGAGGAVNVTGGTSGGGATAGGLVTVQGGASQATAGSAGGGVTLQGAAGSTTGTGAVGGTIALNAGNSGGTNNNTGGAITLQGGTASGNAAAIGGAITIAAGAGGATAGSLGGQVSITGGAGTATGTGAAGSAVNINGGAANGTGANNGGGVVITGGMASANATSVGGSVTLQGGPAGATAGSAGGAVAIYGANGTATGTGGAGGTVLIEAGDGTSNGNNNGGNIQLTAGNATGNGVPGVVQIDTPVFTNVNQTFTQTGNGQAFPAAGAETTTLQSNIDGFSTLTVNITGAFTGSTVTIPNPKNTATGRVVYVAVANGSVGFTLAATGMKSILMSQNSTAMLVWNGYAWTGSAAATSLQDVYNNTSGSPAGIITTSATKNLLFQAGVGFDNANVFQVGNSLAAPILAVDTTNTATGANLAQNSGLEVGATTNWAVVGSSTLSVNAVAANLASGAGSLDINLSAAGGASNTLSGTLAINSLYNVSFNIKTSGTAPTLVVEYYRDATTFDATCSTPTNGTINSTGFFKYTCYFTTSATAKSAPNQLRIRQSDATARHLYVDNLSVSLQNSTGAANTGDLQVGGPLSQGLTLFTFDSFAATPFTGTGNTALLGSIYYDTTIGRIQCYESDGWGACGAAQDNNVTMVPEYGSAVLSPGDSVASGHLGAMTANMCSGSSRFNIQPTEGTICAATDEYSYYRWTSGQVTAQTYSIFARYQLPPTFKNFYDANTVVVTGLVSSTTDAALAYSMWGSTGVQCGSSSTNITPSANTWTTTGLTVDETTCGGNPPGVTGFSPGNVITFKIDMSSKNNAYAYVSNIQFTMKGK